MSVIWEWVAYSLPWWVQALAALAPIAVIIALLARCFGLRVALQVGGGLLAILAVISGRQQARQQGWAERGKSDARKARDRADAREAIHDDVRNASDADLDRRLDRWVRD